MAQLSRVSPGMIRKAAALIAREARRDQLVQPRSNVHYLPTPARMVGPRQLREPERGETPLSDAEVQVGIARGYIRP